MGYSSVQIFGRTAAVKAFQNTDCMNWSLLQGRQLLFKYEGSEVNEGGTQLDQLLKMIAESSGSDAVYTLRWYERDDIPKEGKRARPLPKFKIYENTPFDGSFNFKLFDQEGSGGNGATKYRELQEMKSEVAELKTMLQQLVKDRNEADQEEKVSGIAGIFNSLLETPEMKSAIVGKVVQLFNGVSNKIGSYLDPGAKNLPAKIAGPTDQPITMPQDQINMLNTALTTLAKLDPQLPEHLFKLSQIAEKDPATYNSLIGMLNKM